MKYTALIALLALTACSTAYKPRGMFGGYEELALGNGQYLVNFYGNGYTSSVETQTNAIRRAKEICDQQKAELKVLDITNLSEAAPRGMKHATQVKIQCISMNAFSP